MSVVSTESIFVALFNLLKTADKPQTPFTVMSRRFVPWGSDSSGNWPALYVRQTKQLNKGMQTIRTMKCDVWVYLPIDQSPDTILSTQMNNYKDAVENALRTVDDSYLTLGGLVTNCSIDGTVLTFEGIPEPPSILYFPISILTGN